MCPSNEKREAQKSENMGALHKTEEAQVYNGQDEDEKNQWGKFRPEGVCKKRIGESEQDGIQDREA